MKPFPWDEAMQFGFGVLRLSPDAFCQMTPRELSQAVIGVRGAAVTPIDRGGLEQLMQRFPDQGVRHE
ncbi:phage tail assembly chaperone [Tardiphaga sp. vice304]|uniref:rcc01693 family protein n=1 Tax=Tardiphaga sp. vice304 TaxID=2592817 RepID=UPI001165AAFE|nr:rcc01693 family protein [Tardiphaga sp. vice304]QDM26790.1 phage tail assembly chaperone [Tardiphaga sp. vice304]